MSIYTLAKTHPFVYIIKVEERGAAAKASQPTSSTVTSKPETGAERYTLLRTASGSWQTHPLVL